jgi:hypothetical protein
MYAKVIINAILTTLISLCTMLGLLFTTKGIASFSDISEVAYGYAIITSIAAGLVLLKTSLSDSPANIKQTDSIVAAAANLNLPTPEKSI